MYGIEDWIRMSGLDPKEFAEKANKMKMVHERVPHFRVRVTPSNAVTVSYTEDLHKITRLEYVQRVLNMSLKFPDGIEEFMEYRTRAVRLVDAVYRDKSRLGWKACIHTLEVYATRFGFDDMISFR